MFLPQNLKCQNCKSVTIPENYFVCNNKSTNCPKFCSFCKFTCFHNSKLKRHNIICPNCVVQYKHCDKHHIDYCVSCEDHQKCSV